jgi:membrane associated rhomboid family serine protease
MNESREAAAAVVQEYQAVVHMVRASAVRPLATWLTAACLLVVHVWMHVVSRGLSSADDDSELVWRMAMMVGARSTELMVESGQWWRLASHLWIHATADHLMGNLVLLVMLGTLVERMYGASRMVVAATVTALAGALASTMAGVPLSVGISGAILGLAGVLAGLFVRYRGRLPERVVRHIGQLGAFLVVLVALMTLAVSGVDHVAHGVGFVVGLVMGLAMRSRAMDGPQRTDRAWLELARVSLALHLFGWLCLGVEWGRCVGSVSEWEVCYQGVLM